MPAMCWLDSRIAMVVGLIIGFGAIKPRDVVRVLRTGNGLEVDDD
jgi:uncharacterized membrane-anchored protein YhcB (DUF1043 family)